MIGAGRIKILFLGVALVWLGAASLLAEVRVSNLYDVEVEVTDQSLSARNEATRKGLEIVLTRVSGRQDLASIDAISDALKSAGNYRLSSRYLSREVNGESKLFIYVKYNATRVNGLLARADLPLWGDSRPSTLVWIAVEDGRNRYILGSGQSSDVTNQIKQHMKQIAKQRGVPLMYPLMDLEDRQKVRFSDIMGGFYDSIKKASARYSADAILIGKLRRRGGTWTAQWTLVTAERSTYIETKPQTLDLVIAGGVHGTANYLASNVSTSSPVVVTNDDPRLKVSIVNITSMNDYAAVIKFVSELASVRSVQVVQVKGSRVTLSVDLKSSVGQFKSAMGENGKFKIDEDDESPVLTPEGPSDNSDNSDQSQKTAALKYRYTP